MFNRRASWPRGRAPHGAALLSRLRVGVPDGPAAGVGRAWDKRRFTQRRAKNAKTFVSSSRSLDPCLQHEEHHLADEALHFLDEERCLVEEERYLAGSLDTFKLDFDAAEQHDPTVAQRYPSLTALRGACSVAAKRGAATRKEMRRAAAKPPATPAKATG